MLIDSSNALDRLIPNILTLAFDLAGQSPTSLKLICVQQDIADELIYLLTNAMIELDIAVSDYSQGSVGPVLNATKQTKFNQYVEKLTQQARMLRQTPLEHGLDGHYVAPCLFQVNSLSQLDADIDGPVLHIYCFSSSAIPQLIDELNGMDNKGYCSIHSQQQQNLRQFEHGILGRQLLINQSHSLPIATYHATLYDKQACMSYSQMESQLCQNAGKTLMHL